MEGLKSTRENEIIFGKVIKGRNLFTPYSLAYYRPKPDIIVELSTENDSQGNVNGFGFKGKYGVTVIRMKDGNWERDIASDKLCYSYKEAKEYIKSLGDKENEV